MKEIKIGSKEWKLKRRAEILEKHKRKYTYDTLFNRSVRV
ncbi:hypothetical protein JOC62_003375 [Clostridium sardiniense]|nr:hypothetical protein [Clostridium sardiniense]